MAQMATSRDVWIIGAGPAGLALAAACGDRGLSVGCIAPAEGARWTNNYGMWLDDARSLGVDTALRSVWDDVEVQWPDERPVVLGRAYGLLDNEALAARDRAAIARAGGELRYGEVVSVTHTDALSTVHARDGSELRARLVIDASGHGAHFSGRRAGTAPAFQTAFGAEVDVPVGSPLGRGVRLMDYGHRFDDEDRFGPSFAYALPLGDGRVFVEETALVRRPAVPIDHLRVRLMMRLDAWRARGWVEEVDRAGVDATEGSMPGEERCWIPMGHALPDPRSRVVPFGGAASMVHPASGYMVTEARRAAPRVAAAIARAQSSDTVATRARDVHAAVWPADRQRQRALYCFGMNTLATLDHRGIQRFFQSFFSLPCADWSAFLSGTLSTAELVRVMSIFYVLAPWSLRARLAEGLFTAHGRELALAIRESSRLRVT